MPSLGLRAAMLLAVATAAGTAVEWEFGFGLRHEAGVETRLPLSALAALEPLPSLRLRGGLAANLARPGLPDRYALEARWSFAPWAGVAAGAVLRRWPAWRAGENLAFASATGRPLDVLELEAGICRRVPLLDSAQWRSPLVWNSSLAEWNVVYGVGWRFVNRPELALAVRTGNRAALAVRTPGLPGLRVEGERTLGRGWRALAAAGAEVKGLSSALLELGAVELEVGVRRGAGR
ncbi:MAG: hypothetical protein R6X12_07060 [bacterium]